MDVREGTFESQVDGIRLYARAWHPHGETKGVVVISHGYMEHCGRYEDLARHLNGKGFSVYSYDHRGHGRSDNIEGLRGFFRHFGHFVADLGFVVRSVIRHYAAKGGARPISEIMVPTTGGALAPSPKVPVFLLGHSMGALTAAHLLVDTTLPLRGSILCSGFFDFYDRIGCVQTTLMSAIGALWPKFPIVKIPSDSLSHDPAELEKYENDPQNLHASCTAHAALQFKQAHDHVRAHRSKINVRSLFVFHGTEDRLTPFRGSEEFSSAFTENGPVKDFTFQPYPGAYHELFHETPALRDPAVHDVTEWLVARL